jgi:adenylate cyclase
VSEVTDRLRALGLPEEAIQRALERGDPESAIFETVVLAHVAERTVTPAEIEARGGLTLAELTAVMEALGLPTPASDQPSFTEEEGEVFVQLGRLREVWPPEIALQVSRVYGRLLARIAQTEVDTFRIYVEPRLREASDDPLGGMLAVQRAFAALLPLADPLLTGVHQRWLEYELAQVAVTAAESETGGRLPGAVDIAVLFVDLKDFTAYADTHGDEAAVAAIQRLIETVDHERGQVRFQKTLGDGVMLCYSAAADAVAAARRIIRAMRADSPPGVHASVHRGTAMLREGDYFGSAVNVAARLLDTASENELIATQPIVDACEEFTWESAGLVRLRGVAQPLATFRLRL